MWITVLNPLLLAALLKCADLSAAPLMTDEPTPRDIGSIGANPGRIEQSFYSNKGSQQQPIRSEAKGLGVGRIGVDAGRRTVKEFPPDAAGAKRPDPDSFEGPDFGEDLFNGPDRGSGPDSPPKGTGPGSGSSYPFHGGVIIISPPGPIFGNVRGPSIATTNIEGPDVVFQPGFGGSGGQLIIDGDSSGLHPAVPVIVAKPGPFFDEDVGANRKHRSIHPELRTGMDKRSSSNQKPYRRPNGECLCGLLSKTQHDVLHDIGQIGINKGWIKEYNTKRYFGPPGDPDYDQEDIGEIGINKGTITEYNREFRGGWDDSVETDIKKEKNSEKKIRGTSERGSRSGDSSAGQVGKPCVC